MTREEAMNLVKQVLPCLNIDKKIREAFETLIPELRENEDERIRKDIVAAVEMYGDFTQSRKEEIYSYLEKQTDYLSSTRVETFSDGTTVRHSIGYLEKGKEQQQEKKEVKFVFPKFLYARTTNNKTIDMSYAPQSLDAVEYIRSDSLNQEPKPILEVFGFKVGDAVRLIDGDGRKHIIKSFEKIEGLHGSDFYHVVFEDNTASDHIIPGDEYPNGYFTCMEKIEEEQKPRWEINNPHTTKWTKEMIDEKFEELVEEYHKQEPAECGGKGRRGRIGITPKHIRKKAENFLSKMEPPYDADDICSAYETGAMENANPSWSEEDESFLDSIEEAIHSYYDLNHAPQYDYWLEEKLKSLRPQPKAELTLQK